MQIKESSETIPRQIFTLFSGLFNNLQFDLWAVDPDYNYIFQNPVSMENWGLVEGKNITELDIAPELRSEWLEQLNQVSAGKTLNFEYSIKDDSEILQSTISPVIHMGRLRCIVGITLNITQVRRNENLVSEKTKEIDQINQAFHVLLERFLTEKRSAEETAREKIGNRIQPLLNRLKEITDNPESIKLLDSIESVFDVNAKKETTLSLESLSYTERNVANQIRKGKSSKEIAAIMGIAKNTVDTHRRKIREKLGLKNSQTNLKDYLSSFRE